MNNKGQTTVFFTFVISALLIFTLSALELGRIYMGRVKVAAVIHSAKQSITADYNRELFERYHLLFADPTYGTGSEAVLEEKIKDYLEASLQETTGSLYDFSVDEICVIDAKNILSNNMKRLKEQIEEYEKTAGIAHRAKEVEEKMKGEASDINEASRETENNAVEMPVKNNKSKKEKNDNVKMEVEDPRDTVKDSLKFGILSFLKPKDMDISKAAMELKNAPSSQYEEWKEDEKDNSFQDIKFLKGFIKKNRDNQVTLSQRAALLDYVDYHFFCVMDKQKKSAMKCEMEYIIEGKDNDYANVEAVVNDITWMRMPVNYAYLLTDTAKKGEALTLAAAICAATGTEPLIEVVKYLLLGCWAYGETLCEVKDLLEGKKIAYIKNSSNWKTDLKSPTVAKIEGNQEKTGISYEDYLLILLGKKNKKSLNKCYARILDLIELNLQQTDETFSFQNYMYEVTIQGKVSMNSIFVNDQDKSLYDYYFEEKITY